MAEDSTSGPTDKNIKASILWIKSKVMDVTNGEAEKDILDNGSTTKDMGSSENLCPWSLVNIDPIYDTAGYAHKFYL